MSRPHSLARCRNTPALVVGAHDMQLGIRKVTLGLVVGGLHHRLGGFAAAGLARPRALRFCFRSALTLGLRLPLGLRPPPPHCRIHLCQAPPTAGPRRGAVVPPPAPRGASASPS